MKAYSCIITFLFGVFILLLSFPVDVETETYYIRTDGGSFIECTGISDAPYPGSGNKQDCALAHPFYLLDPEGKCRIQGGDTVVIESGIYQMGYGAPNTSNWCSASYPYDCHLPPFPSGTLTRPTRILGRGWNSG